MSIRNYRDLVLWQKGVALAMEVYRLSRGFPRHERFGLSSQVQRAAVSVSSNIAEGQSRRHTGEFRQFLYQSLGSLAEVDTQLVLAHELGYLSEDEVEKADAMVSELRRMIHGLVSRLPHYRREYRSPTTHH